MTRTIYTVDQNSFHKPAPREVHGVVASKPVSTFDFSGLEIPTGKIGPAAVEEFETYLEAVYPQASTHTFYNEDFARVLTVIDGSGFIVMTGAKKEDLPQKLGIKKGSIITIPVNTSYRLVTEHDSLVVSCISDIGYGDSVKLEGNTEIASGHRPITPRIEPIRGDSAKTIEQLVAQQKALDNRVIGSNVQVVHEGESFDNNFAPDGDNPMPLNFV